MDQNRDLLLGILAEREKNIAGDALSQAVTLWQAQPGTSLAQVLVEQNLLSAGDLPSLEAKVDALVAEHQGRVDSALASLGGETWLEDMLRLSTVPLGAGAEPGTVPMAEHTFLSDSTGQRSTVEETPGRYTLVSQHAKGGMGRVLLVHDHHLQRDVAFKELLPRLDQSTIGQDTPIQQISNMAARFLQEARITGQLEHPAIVPVYELGRRKDGSLYYTMKLVKGKTLWRAVKDCADLQERLALLGNFMDLCHAIAYAHSRGVIHRDIKPGNIMVGQFGETVVLDWGLAKLGGAEDLNTGDIEKTMQILNEGDESMLPSTAYGRALGTPHYMPPEQAEGRIDEIDARSDVYSLGAVLYEILTGTTPYTGKSTKEILHKRLTEEPAPVLTAAPDAPPALASICQKALQTDKGQRYQSAIELAEDVQRFITGSLVKAYQYSIGEVLGHFYRRHRFAIHTVAAAAIAVIAVAIYSYINILNARNREHDQRLIAEKARDAETIARQDEEKARVAAERANYLNQLSLTQAYIDRQDYAMANKTMDAAKPEQRGWEWGYLKNRANPDLWTVNTAPERICIVTFSPDGALIATATATGILQTWDTETGQLKTTFEPGAPVPAARPLFSPDGTLLITAGQDDRVRIWDVATGKLKHNLDGHRGQAAYAEFSPDGTEAVSTAFDGSLQFWDVASGTSREAMKTDSGSFRKALYAPGGDAFVTVSTQNEIVAWNRAGLAERFRAPGNDAVLSGDGRWLAVIQKGNAALFDLASGAPGQMLKGEGEIQRLRFNRAADRVLTGSSDGQVRIYDAATGALLRTYLDRVLSGNLIIDEVAFAEKESVVLAWDRGNTGYAWDAATGNLLNRIPAADNIMFIVDFGQDGRRAAVATSGPLFQCLDPLYQTGRRLLKDGNATESLCNLAACEATGQMALSSSRDIRLVSQDPAAPMTVFAIPRLRTNAILVPAISPDGTRVALASDAFCPSVWDSAASQRVFLQGHSDWVSGIAFDPSGTRVATASFDATARIWDAASGNCLATLEGHQDPLSDIEFSPDGAQVLTSSWDRTAALWDAASGKRLRVFEGHTGLVNDAVFDPEGRRIFTASQDGTVRVWDAQTGATLETISEHSAPVQMVRLAPGGPFLVTSASDGTTRLWNAQNLEPGLVFPGVIRARFLVESRRGIPKNQGLSQASEPRERDGTVPDFSQLAGNLRDGRVESWEAAPWSEPNTAPAAFDAYRKQDYAKRKDSLAPNPIPGKIYLETSNRILDLALENLSLLGLDATDQLVAVDKQRANTPEESTQLLDDLRAAAQQQPSGQWNLLIRRGVAEIPAELRLAPLQEVKIDATLSREEAQRLAQCLKNALLVEQQDTRTYDLEGYRFDTLLQSAGIGHGLALQPSDKQQTDGTLALLRKAHLAMLERVVRIDEVTAIEDGALLRYVGDLAERIASGACTGFTIETQHGSYQRNLIKYTIK